MDDLFANAALLTLYGMGTVFLFLALLVVLTVAMSALLQQLAPVPAASAKTADCRPASTAATSSDRVARAAVAAALHHHRQR